jgi:prophage regulatory protein
MARHPRKATRSKLASDTALARRKLATAALARRLALSELTALTIDGMPVTAVLPAEGLVKLQTVLQVYPVGESTWWEGVREGRYPKPVHIGVKSRAWRVADIRRLIAAAEPASTT